MYTSQLLFLSLLPLSWAGETVIGAYIFHRHGDRTAKSTPPANLTSLGYQEVFTSGQYFRSRYVASDASLKIAGLNTDIVKQSQISVSAPSDTVLLNSAQGFLQGLYPPVGTSLASQTLRNGSVVQAPLNGYQLIPIALVSSGSGSEDNGWLQDASSCANAQTSSNNFFLSAEYENLLHSTQPFYNTLSPVVNGTFSAAQTSFKNAYTIFDLISVADIHNATIPSSDVLTDDVLFQARAFANAHEWGLAYNASDNARAVPGMQLAAEIVRYLNGTITTAGKQKLGIQFGAYASFLSFFGLADLPATNPDFYGIPDYASAMVFELFTNGPATPFPAASDLQVRFLFHNGTSRTGSEQAPYPLFGGSELAIPWTTFVDRMSKFSVGTTEEWCKACGNTTGTCAAYVPKTTAPGASSSSSSSSHDGVSTAVGGVIGALVTLAVVLGVEALIMLIGGYMLVSRKKLAQAPMEVNGESMARKAQKSVKPYAHVP